MPPDECLNTAVCEVAAAAAAALVVAVVVVVAVMAFMKLAWDWLFVCQQIVCISIAVVAVTLQSDKKRTVVLVV